MPYNTDRRLTRRGLIRGSGSLASATTGLLTPAISRAADRPLITHGLQSGDVTANSAMV
jgi:alkaline phosphatase D